MVCKCCVPGCKSNYESAGKEGRCSTFGFPLDLITTTTIQDGGDHVCLHYH